MVVRNQRADWVNTAKAVRIETFLTDEYGWTPSTKNSHEWRGPCPACGGSEYATKFSIDVREQRANCFGGCGCQGDIIAIVRHIDDLSFDDAVTKLVGPCPQSDGKASDARVDWKHPEAEFDYRDENGTLLYQNVRYPVLAADGSRRLSRKGKPDKRFIHRRPDGNGQWIYKQALAGVRRVPYRLPELKASLDADRTVPVFISEGEAKADLIRSWGLTATSIESGLKDHSAFAGADVVVLPDNDSAGRNRANHTLYQLHVVAKRVRCLPLPGLGEGEDVADWANRGGTGELLMALADTIRDWSPPIQELDADEQTSNDPWDDPDLTIIEDQRGDLPEFPLDVLNPRLADCVVRMARARGCTTAHVAPPLIAIAGGLIGLSRRVSLASSFLQPATTWCALVGYSGVKKSPGQRASKDVIDHMVKTRRPKELEQQAEHEAAVEMAAIAKAAWKAQAKKARSKGLDTPEMPEDAKSPGPFIPRRLYVDDVTIERVAYLHQGRPRGMVLITDELTSLLMNMSRYSGGNDRPHWLAAYEGKARPIDRQTREPIYLEHWLVGVVGTIQPSRLAECFRDGSDGLSARWLFTWVPQPPHSALSDEAMEIEPDLVNCFGRLDSLKDTDDEGRFVSRTLRPSLDARREFEGYRALVADRQRGMEGLEAEWLSKVDGNVGRLALTLAYLDWSLAYDQDEPTDISADVMRCAIRLVEFFWPHARACLRIIGLTERHATARRIMRWAVERNLQSFTSREARREALSQRFDPDQVKSFLKFLESRGLIRQEQVAERKRGRPSETWVVNPVVLNPHLRFSAILATEFDGDDDHRFSAVSANGKKNTVKNQNPIESDGGIESNDDPHLEDGAAKNENRFSGQSQLPFAINAKNPPNERSEDTTRASRDAYAKNAKNHHVEPEARLCSDADEPNDDPTPRRSSTGGASGGVEHVDERDDGSDLNAWIDGGTIEGFPADGSSTKLLTNGAGHLRCIVCNSSNERVVRLDNGLCLHTRSRSCVLAFNAMHDVVTKKLPAHGIELVLDHGQLLFDKEAGAQVPADLRAQIIANPGLAAIFCRYER
jgi:hypothetical protein